MGYIVRTRIHPVYLRGRKFVTVIIFTFSGGVRVDKVALNRVRLLLVKFARAASPNMAKQLLFTPR